MANDSFIPESEFVPDVQPTEDSFIPEAEFVPDTDLVGPPDFRQEDYIANRDKGIADLSAVINQGLSGNEDQDVLSIHQKTGAPPSEIKKAYKKFYALAKSQDVDVASIYDYHPEVAKLLTENPYLTEPVLKDQQFNWWMKRARRHDEFSKIQAANNYFGTGSPIPDFLWPLDLAFVFDEITEDTTKLEKAPEKMVYQQKSGAGLGEIFGTEWSNLRTSVEIGRLGMQLRDVEKEISDITTKFDPYGLASISDELPGLNKQALDLKIQIAELESKNAAPTDWGAGGLTQLGIDMLQGGSSQIETIKGMTTGAFLTGAVPAALTLAATKNWKAAGKMFAEAGSVGAAIGSFLQARNMEGGGDYLERIKAGDTPEQAWLSSELTMDTKALLEMTETITGFGLAGLGAVGKRFALLATEKGIAKAAKDSAVKNIFNGMVGEGLTENLQSWDEDLIPFFLKNAREGGTLQQGVDLFDWEKASEKADQAFYLGAVGSLGVSGGMALSLKSVPLSMSAVQGGLKYTLKKIDDYRSGIAAKQTEELLKLSTGETAKAAPKAVAKMVIDYNKRKRKPVKHAYIDPKRLLEVEQSLEMAPGELVTELLGEGSEKRVQTAMAEYVDADGQRASLRVSIDELIGKIGPHKAATMLLPDMTVAEGALTRRELTESNKRSEKYIAERSKELIGKTEEWLAGTEAKSFLRSSIEEQLLATDKFSPEAVDAQAAIAQAYAETLMQGKFPMSAENAAVFAGMKIRKATEEDILRMEVKRAAGKGGRVTSSTLAQAKDFQLLPQHRQFMAAFPGLVNEEQAKELLAIPIAELKGPQVSEEDGQQKISPTGAPIESSQVSEVKPAPQMETGTAVAPNSNVFVENQRPGDVKKAALAFHKMTPGARFYAATQNNQAIVHKVEDFTLKLDREKRGYTVLDNNDGSQIVVTEDGKDAFLAGVAMYPWVDPRLTPEQVATFRSAAIAPIEAILERIRKNTGVPIGEDGTFNALQVYEVLRQTRDADRWLNEFETNKDVLDVYSKKDLARFRTNIEMMRSHMAEALESGLVPDEKAATDSKHTQLRKNEDFIKSLDISTVCPRQDLYVNTIYSVERRLGKVLNSVDRYKVGAILYEAGVLPACWYCYGQASRNAADEVYVRSLELLHEVIDYVKETGKKPPPAKYQEMLRKWKPTTEYAKGLLANIDKYKDVKWPSELRFRNMARGMVPIKDPIVKEYIDTARGLVSAVVKENQPKGWTSLEQEILVLDQDLVDEFNARAGLRLNSQTDFRPWHVIETSQAIAEMFTRKLNAHVYTKEAAFVRIFGKTGLKFNLSAYYITNNGKVVLDERGLPQLDGVYGMTSTEIEELMSKYPKEVGGMLVAHNDAALLAGLNDKRIKQIIPYHKGKVKALVGEFEEAKDYTKQQHEIWFKGEKGVVDGKNVSKDDTITVTVDGKSVEVIVGEHLNAKHFKNDIQFYLKLCDKLGCKPKFADTNVEGFGHLVEKDKKGHWKMRHEGYAKLIRDVAVPEKQRPPNPALIDWDEAKNVFAQWEEMGGDITEADPKIVDHVLKKVRSPDFATMKGPPLEARLDAHARVGGTQRLQVAPWQEPSDEQAADMLGETLQQGAAKYKEAGEMVGGLRVSDDVPNTKSIGATLDKYTTLPGIREVPLSAFEVTDPQKLFYAANDLKRVEQLAAEIKESETIKPLIVVVDEKGPYVLEGGHRLGALHTLGIKSLPAMVVYDDSNGELLQQPAWHGSPVKDIKKFSLDKVLTGEGAMAWGHGMYFAGNKVVSEKYRQSLSKGKIEITIGSDTYSASQFVVQKTYGLADRGGKYAGVRAIMGRIIREELERGGDPTTKSVLAQTKKEIENFAVLATGSDKEFMEQRQAEIQAEFDEMGELGVEIKHPGQLYKVEIPDNHQLLHYDKKLNDQPQVVQKFAREFIKDLNENVAKKELQYPWRIENIDYGFANLDGKNLYKAVAAEYARAQWNKDPIALQVAAKHKDKTGADPYSQAERRASEEYASLTLQAAGILGAKYLDQGSRTAGEGTYNFVIWDEPSMKIVETLYQGDEDNLETRGWIEINRQGINRVMEIFISDKADISTPIHEVTHAYFEMLADIVKEPDAPQRLKDIYQDTIDTFDVKSWDDMSEDNKEELARSFEAYLMEGKAPSIRLVKVFQQLRNWLFKIYGHIRSLNVEVLPQLRSVFDRLLASDEEIKEAHAAMGLKGEPDVQVQLEVARLQKGVLDKAWQDEVNNLLPTAEAEYNRDKTYRAWRFIMRGEETDEKGVVNKETSKVSHKDDKGNLITERGYVGRMERKAVLKLLPLSSKLAQQLLPRLAKKGGYKPNDVADMFGFIDAKEMFSALAEMKPKDDAVYDLAEQKALLARPEIAEDLAKVRKVIGEQLHRGTPKQILNDLKELSESGGYKDIPPIESFQRAAQFMASRHTLRRLNLTTIRNRERNMAEKSALAAGRKDSDRALDYKKEQLVAHYLYREIEKIIDWRDKFDTKLSKLQSRTAQETLGMAGGSYRDVVNTILEAIGAKEKEEGVERQGLMAAVADLTKDDLAIGFNPERVEQLLKSGNEWKDFTFEDIKEVSAVLDQLYTASQDRLGVRIENERRRVEEISESILRDAERGPDKGTLPLQDTEAKKGQQKEKSMMGSILAANVRPLQMFTTLGQTAKSFFWNRYLDARKTSDDLTRDVLGYLEKNWMPKEMLATLHEEIEDANNLTITSNIREGRLTRSHMLMIALNMGNESNKERLLGGYEWQEKDVQAWLQRNMTKRDWEFVNSMWALFDGKLKSAMAATYKDIHGIEPKMITATPWIVTHDDGTTTKVTGGYFPAKYDPKDTAAGANQAGAEVRQLYNEGRATVIKSFTNERAARFSDRISLSFRSVPSHVASVIHYVANERFVRDANRVLQHPATREAIIKRLGAEFIPSLEAWLRDVANYASGTIPSELHGIYKVLNTLKGMAVVSAVGFSLPIAVGDLINPLVANAKGNISNKSLLLSAMKTLPLVTYGDTRRKALAMSPELRHRSERLNENMRWLLNQVQKTTKLGKLQEKAMEAAFWMMDMTDRATSTVIWQAAYADQLKKGLSEEEAIREADIIVQQSLPSHDPAEMAAILRDRTGISALLVFFGWFSVQGNMVYDLVDQAQVSLHEDGMVKGSMTAAAKVGRILAILMLSNVVAEMLSGRGPEDDEEPEEWLMRKMLAAPFTMVPLIGGMAEMGVNTLVGKAFHGDDYKSRAFSIRAAPAYSAIERVVKAIDKVGDDEADADKRIIAMLEAVGILLKLPVGTSQFKRTAGYVASEEGLQEDIENNPLRIPGGLIYGRRKNQPANPFDIFNQE